MSFLRRTLLHEGPLCSLAIVRCHHPPGGPGGEELNVRHSIDLTVSGVFVRHIGGQRVVGSAGNVLLYNRGEVHRVSHPAGGGDRCLSLGVSDDGLRETLGEPPGNGAAPPFPRTYLAAEPAWAAAFHRLWRRVEARAASTLEVEETGLGLAKALAEPLSRMPRSAPERHETRRRRKERVEGVQLLLAGDPARDWSLGDLAHAVASSPFHLSRSFADELGLPVHRWAVRQRLLLSLEPVADGTRRLTDVAADLGFASHAHFTAAFGRAFGVSPSAFRASARRAALVEMSKNLKA